MFVTNKGWECSIWSRTTFEDKELLWLLPIYFARYILQYSSHEISCRVLGGLTCRIVWRFYCSLLWIRSRVTRDVKTEDPRRAKCGQKLSYPFLSNIRHLYWSVARGYFVLSVYQEHRILILDSSEFQEEYRNEKY